MAVSSVVPHTEGEWLRSVVSFFFFFFLFYHCVLCIPGVPEGSPGPPWSDRGVCRWPLLLALCLFQIEHFTLIIL